jgi:hypothetical protein
MVRQLCYSKTPFGRCHRLALHQRMVVKQQPTIASPYVYACSPDMALDAVPHTVQPACAEPMVTDVKRLVSTMQVYYDLQQGGTLTAHLSTCVSGTWLKNATLYARYGCTSAMLPILRMQI